MRPALLAELSGADLTLVVVTVCSIAAVVAMLFAVTSLVRAVRETREALDALTETAVPLIADLQSALVEANAELARVDRLVGSAESISATVDATSKLAYRALSAPVIKTVAVTSGARRAGRRLRKD